MRLPSKTLQKSLLARLTSWGSAWRARWTGRTRRGRSRCRWCRWEQWGQLGEWLNLEASVLKQCLVTQDIGNLKDLTTKKCLLWNDFINRKLININLKVAKSISKIPEGNGEPTMSTAKKVKCSHLHVILSPSIRVLHPSVVQFGWLPEKKGGTG